MSTTNGSFNETSTGWMSWKDFHFQDKLHFVILALFIVAVNSCVIIAVYRSRFLRKPENYLLVSLASSDLSTGLIGLPLVLICSASPWSDCMSCYTSFMFTRLLSISTILHLLAVALERYVLIVRPFCHRRIRVNKYRVVIAIACLWLVSLIVSAVPFLWLRSDSCMNEEDGKLWLIYTTSCLVVFFLLPTLLLIYVFGCIFMAARGYIRKQEALTAYVSVQEERNVYNYATLRKEARVAIVFMLMWLTFLVCWSPYFVLNLIDELGMEIVLPDWVWIGTITLRFLTSLLNPLLYSFLKQDFQQVLRLDRVVNFLMCRWCLSGNTDSRLQDNTGISADGTKRSYINITPQDEFVVHITTV